MSLAWPIGRDYKTVVMDPPWPLSMVHLYNSGYKSEMPYDLEGLLYISRIPIRKITDKNSRLFIWTTHRFLPDCLNLMKNWGFKYNCLFIWDKYGGPQMLNCPQYDCEIIVYGYRGTPGEFLSRKAFRTMIRAKRSRHSEKPDDFYEMIERVCPGPRLDIFARRGRGPEWDFWGNEVGWVDGLSGEQLDPSWSPVLALQ